MGWPAAQFLSGTGQLAHVHGCRQALSNARPSCPGRAKFCRSDLIKWGLLVEMGTNSVHQVLHKLSCLPFMQLVIAFHALFTIALHALFSITVHAWFSNNVHLHTSSLLCVALHHSSAHCMLGSMLRLYIKLLHNRLCCCRLVVCSVEQQSVRSWVLVTVMASSC